PGERRLEVRIEEARLRAGQLAPPASRTMPLVSRKAEAALGKQRLDGSLLRDRRQRAAALAARQPALAVRTDDAGAEREGANEDVGELARRERDQQRDHARLVSDRGDRKRRPKVPGGGQRETGPRHRQQQNDRRQVEARALASDVPPAQPYAEEVASAEH